MYDEDGNFVGKNEVVEEKKILKYTK